VNAADNYQKDKSQKYIKVVIDEKEKSISVENDGRGLLIFTS
jgi:DNA gyrase/topoisomerase IV subunit B